MQAKTKRKYNFTLLSVVLIFLVSLFVSLVLLYQAFSLHKGIVETRTLRVSFQILNGLGSELNADSLSFGALPAGSSATRRISIQNVYDFPIVVNFSASKSIVDYLSIDEVGIIEPGTSKLIGVTMYLPSTLAMGNYSGTLKTIIRRA